MKRRNVYLYASQRIYQLQIKAGIRTCVEEGQEVVLEQEVWVVLQRAAEIRQIEQVVDEEVQIVLHIHEVFNSDRLSGIGIYFIHLKVILFLQEQSLNCKIYQACLLVHSAQAPSQLCQGSHLPHSKCCSVAFPPLLQGDCLRVLSMEGQNTVEYSSLTGVDRSAYAGLPVVS